MQLFFYRRCQKCSRTIDHSRLWSLIPAAWVTELCSVSQKPSARVAWRWPACAGLMALGFMLVWFILMASCKLYHSRQKNDFRKAPTTITGVIQAPMTIVGPQIILYILWVYTDYVCVAHLRIANLCIGIRQQVQRHRGACFVWSIIKSTTLKDLVLKNCGIRNDGEVSQFCFVKEIR